MFFQKIPKRFPAPSALGAALFLGLLALYVGVRYYSTSPLNIWENETVYHTGYLPLKSGDSAVFLYVGREILSGGMPYRDVFDHKGPLVYLVNAAGLALGGPAGVWFFELLSLWGCVFFFYRTARLSAGRLAAALAAAAGLLSVVALLKGGNFTETYALPFQAATLCWFCRFLKQDFFLSKSETFRCGAEFGAVFLLRPNMTGIWILFCGAVLADAVCRRRGRFLFSRAGLFLGGTGLVCLPVLVWLALRGAGGEFLRQFWFYNLSYTSLADAGQIAAALRYFFGLSGYLLIAPCLFLLAAARPDARFPRSWGVLFALNFLLGLCLLAMPGRCDTHYVISLAVCWYPAQVWLTVLLARCLKRIRRRRFAAVPAALAAALLLLPLRPVLDGIDFHDFSRYRARLRESGRSPLTDPVLDETVKWVSANLAPGETLAGYGENSIARILVYTGRRSASKYIYTPSLRPPIAENPVFLDQLASLRAGAPDCLVRERRSLSGFDVKLGTRDPDPEPLRAWREENGYEKVFENEGFEIYRRPKAGP